MTTPLWEFSVPCLWRCHTLWVSASLVAPSDVFSSQPFSPVLPGALSCLFLSTSLGLQFPFMSQHHPNDSLSPGLPLLPSDLFWYLHLGLSNFAFLLPSPKISISIPITVSCLLPKSPLNFSVSGLHACHPLSNSQQQIPVPRFSLVHPVLPPHSAQYSLRPPSPAACTARSTWSHGTCCAPSSSFPTM